MAWDDELQKFDDSALLPMFAEVDTNRDHAAGLNEGRTMTRAAAKRRYARIERAVAAAEAIGRLPEPGESIHGIMSGTYDGWALVPAVIELAEGATVDHLWVATLGFNRDNVESLAGMLDAGQVRRVSFIASCWFRTTDTTVWEHTATELTRRGHRCVAVRSHAKVILFELSDGRALAWEASANLRSCKNVEQFALHHAPDLVEFHKSWMDELISQALAAEARKQKADATEGKEAQARRIEKAGRQPRKAKAQDRRTKPAGRKRRARPAEPPGRTGQG